MVTLDEAVSIAYKSSAVAYAAANTKDAISRVQRDQAKEDRDSLTPDTPEYLEAEKRHTLWWNYYTAQGFAKKFFMYDSTGPIRGVKKSLEDLWVQMGNNIVDLPDWDTYASADLKTVVSFINKAGLNETVITDAEAAFTGNSSEIPTTDFETQFEEMFDLFINDIWAAEGMRIWCDDELVRTGEAQADLDEWDRIRDSAGQFFANAKRCCVRLANNFSQYETGGPNEAAYIVKYTYGPSNRYNAIDGLYALDPSTLPANYIARVENKIVTYR